MYKLLFNDDKTNLLIIKKLRHKAIAKEVKITTDKGVMKPKEKFKILGWFLNRNHNYNLLCLGAQFIIGSMGQRNLPST